MREACQAGVDAEIANVALYDRLMQNTSRQDILAVFENLRRASQERHLPALRRCAERGAGRGPRRG
jgi:rubrerythrin